MKKGASGVFSLVLSMIFIIGTIASAFAQIVPPVTPPADTPPVISAIVATSVSSVAENVSWITDKLSVSTFQYGTTTSYGSSANILSSAAIGGTAALTGLTPATTYYFCITATDTARSSSSACGQSFTTAAAPASVVVPPVVSAITVTSIATSTATITWTTDKATTAQVAYGTSASYGSTSSLDSNLGLMHSTTLSNLASNTIYHYQVRSADSSGNLTMSTDATFATGALPPPPQVIIPADTTPPVISGVSEASINSTDATIIWSTDELATSTLTYGTTTSYGSQTTLDVSALLAHTATIVNLVPNTLYYYCITATDLAGNSANSCGHTFTSATPLVSTPTSPVVIDTTPPTISLVTIAPLATSTATVTWATDKVANGQIEYGTTTGYRLSAGIDTDFALTDSADLSGLIPNATYHYRIRSSDQVGNVAYSNDNTFTTDALPVVNITPTPRTTPPVISGITTSTIAENTATIAWTTDETAVSTMSYGTTLNYGSIAALPAGAVLEHTATLTSLTSNTTYYYCIHATDVWGNVASSCGQSFTTGAAPAVTPPLVIISTNSIPTSTPTSTVNISSTVIFAAIQAQSVGTSNATITWATDLPSDSKVNYGVNSQLGSSTPVDGALTTLHSVMITDLAPNTNYVFDVASTLVGASKATVSGNHEFNTLAVPVFTTTPANVSGVRATVITTSTATIGWTTDKAADSQVQYGITTAYGQSTAIDTMLQTAHNVLLGGLAPATTYHYRVRSMDVDGNITFSDDNTFTTVAVQIVTPSVPETPMSTPITPVVISTSTVVAAPDALANLVIASNDHTSATLTWSVDSSGADAASEYDVRYSTSPITQNNFANATEAQLTPILYMDLAPNGTARTYVVAGLASDATYYFAIASKYQTSNWSAISNIVSANTVVSRLPGAPSSTVSVVTKMTENNGGVASGYVSAGGGVGTVSGSSIGTPTLGSATGGDGQIVLNWSDPNQTSFVRTILIKKAGGYPTSPTDGQVIYDGNSETFTDTNVVNGVTYYYAFYSYDRAKNYSAPIHVALAPQSGVSQTTLSGTPTITQPIQYHFAAILAPGSTDIQEVSHLQDILTEAGVYPNSLVTGYFGAITQNALEQYQGLHGIARTGVTDPQTQILLNAASLSDQTMNVPQDLAVFATDLQPGMMGEDVSELQQFLIYEGDYSEAQVTGYFGMLTKDAVIDFQTKYNIVPAIGYVGPVTRHTIETISGF